MSIGLTKKGGMTDHEWFLLLAENGHSSYQFRLAIEVNSKSLKSDRIVETYKWLCLATLLGHSEAKEIAQFIYLGMTDAQISAAYRLIEDWIEDKFAAEKGADRSGWSKELKMFVGLEV